MEEKDKVIIAECLALTMPITKYKTGKDWYEDFKKAHRKLTKNTNKKQTKKKK